VKKPTAHGAAAVGVSTAPARPTTAREPVQTREGAAPRSAATIPDVSVFFMLSCADGE
jgi:hypothetical protein